MKFKMRPLFLPAATAVVCVALGAAHAVPAALTAAVVLLGGTALVYAFKLDRILDEKNRAHALIDAVADALLLIDEQGGLIYSNQAALDLLGIPRQSPGTFLPDSISNRYFSPAFRAILASTERHMSSEVDAAPGNYRITADRLFLPSLERRVCVVVLRDAAGEKAREKVKEDFLHIITHEMRSPLATIQGYADIIMRKLGRSSGTEKYFQSMRYSIRHLRGMVDDILNTTKLRDGTFVLVPAKISANELITRIAGQQEPMTAPKNINIVVETSPQAPEFSGDAELLERVLSAFAGNALRSTPAGGTITFGAGQDAENVIFWVRDTGPGLSEEKRAAFFDKNAPMNKYEALGFAMCGMAVELHKGRIRAESEAGKGCKLSFTIPKGPACPAL